MTKQIRIIFIFFVLLISANTLFAQEKEKKEKKNIFGIILGGTFSEITTYNGNSRQGIIAGLYWEFKLTKKLFYMSNILYSQRGERAKNLQSDIKLAYLNTPFAIKYCVSNKFAVSAGVNWDFLLSVDGKGKNKSDFKKSDWGIPIGVSYDIRKNLQFGVIYSYGLTDITKNDAVKLKNNWGCITLSYIFK